MDHYQDLSRTLFVTFVVGICSGKQVKRVGRRRRESGLVVTWPKRKLEMKERETQEEISTSSDAADAQRGEDESGSGDLVTLTPEILEGRKRKMDFSRKNERLF